MVYGYRNLSRLLLACSPPEDESQILCARTINARSRNSFLVNISFALDVSAIALESLLSIKPKSYEDFDNSKKLRGISMKLRGISTKNKILPIQSVLQLGVLWSHQRSHGRNLHRLQHNRLASTTAHEVSQNNKNRYKQNSLTNSRNLGSEIH